MLKRFFTKRVVVEFKKPEERDRAPYNALGLMLDRQRIFQETYALPAGQTFNDLEVRELVAYIKEHSIHLNQEINEMLYELPFFKPWKTYDDLTPQKVVDKLLAARKEYVDAWHFMLNIGLALGFNEQDLFSEYLEKNQINHKRQEEGY